MREYMRSIAFKLETPITHSFVKKLQIFCLNARRSSMCLQPAGTCVLANCSPPAFCTWKCNRACLTCGWCWCGRAVADSWKTVRSVSLAAYRPAAFWCIIASCEGQIVLPMLQSRFGRSEECYIASEEWKQSIFHTVNTNPVTPLRREGEKMCNASLHSWKRSAGSSLKAGLLY